MFSVEHLQRERHANRGRLLPRTPVPVQLCDLHVFLCRHQSLLNLSCFRTFEFRTSLGTSVLLQFLNPKSCLCCDNFLHDTTPHWRSAKRLATKTTLLYNVINCAIRKWTSSPFNTSHVCHELYQIPVMFLRMH